MSEFESELGSDPIIRAAMERERSGRVATRVALGIVVGNMLVMLFMGWLPPLMLGDPGAAVPYGPMAVNGLAVLILLFGWARITRARTTISGRCEELLQQCHQGSD